jgi:hypothetical protein
VICIVDHPSCCVAVSFIFVVEPHFLLYVQHKLQRVLVNGFHFICMVILMCVACN